jgi:hypothetical protein
MLNLVIDSGRIDLINLGTITPLNFEGYLVVSLSKDWITKFPESIEFNVKINNKGKLCITSESSIKKGERYD